MDNKLESWTPRMRVDLPPNYECSIRRHDGSSDLFVALSHKGSFAFYNSNFECNMLYVKDIRSNYFAQYPGMMSNWLKQLIFEEKVKRVVFFGMSKGGFGALLWSAICARTMPERSFAAVAFSPQTRLYPHNERLKFPSYVQLLDRASKNARLRENLEKYGDLSRFASEPNVHWNIVYCDGNPVDVAEADHLRGPRIRKYPIPFSFHGSTIPFSLHGKSRATAVEEVRNIYEQAEREEDLRFTLPPSPEKLVSDILAAKWIPSLKGILKETMEVTI